MMSGNTRLSKTILHLFGKICTKGKSGFLYSRLWLNSRQLKEVVIKSLIDCKFVPINVEKQRLDQFIIEIAGIITWNLSAKIILKKNNDKFLIDIINLETERWFAFLFDIMLVTYGSASVEIIRKSWKSKNPESGNYIREIVNITFSETVKPYLLPLLEAVPDNLKVRKLSRFFPVEVVGRNKLLEDIVNRDYNLVDLWTKAGALRTIAKIDAPEMAESVIALLFSPEQILQEESANLIKRTGNQLYHSACERLPEAKKERIVMILDDTLDCRDMVFEKVQFLSKCFSKIHEEELITLACELIFVKAFREEDMNPSEGYIVWKTETEDSGAVHIVYNGISSDNRLQYIKDRPCYLLPFCSVEEFHFQFPDESLEILKYIDSHDNNF